MFPPLVIGQTRQRRAADLFDRLTATQIARLESLT
jgi:hypothetical protein